MRQGVTILNFSRDGIVDDETVCGAIKAGKVNAYICDFPSNLLKNHPRVITLPHLGASTQEAEENCAIMVADQVRDYLESGIIRNSVNFPEVEMPPLAGSSCRLSIANANVPHMLEQITSAIAAAGINIVDLINKSKGGVAYTLVDIEQPAPEAVLQKIAATAGVLKVRVLSC
jgi:D-3-phosphoglycerate dehydrogenase